MIDPYKLDKLSDKLCFYKTGTATEAILCKTRDSVPVDNYVSFPGGI